MVQNSGNNNQGRDQQRPQQGQQRPTGSQPQRPTGQSNNPQNQWQKPQQGQQRPQGNPQGGNPHNNEPRRK